MGLIRIAKHNIFISCDSSLHLDKGPIPQLQQHTEQTFCKRVNEQNFESWCHAVFINSFDEQSNRWFILVSQDTHWKSHYKHSKEKKILNSTIEQEIAKLTSKDLGLFPKVSTNTKAFNLIQQLIDKILIISLTYICIIYLPLPSSFQFKSYRTLNYASDEVSVAYKSFCLLIYWKGCYKSLQWALRVRSI